MVFCKNHAVSRCCVPNQILIVSCFFLFSFSFLTFQVENESIRIRTQESLFNGLNMWSFSARPEWKQRDARNILPAVVQQEADKKKKKKKIAGNKGKCERKKRAMGHFLLCTLSHEHEVQRSENRHNTADSTTANSRLQHRHRHTHKRAHIKTNKDKLTGS